ncbi:MAG: hypothetical protein JOZ78_19670 [Chroococcidiopsidaceae cyanobacterium CP_BM_ER_R8_30]|nr:hypothetical protein [Chroococcidiopsidaceae cyanobacterium CP_BM_ER_R8_30]
MAWRGSTTVGDRIFACLPYLLPLIHAIGFGIALFSTFPALQVVLVPLVPVMAVYQSIPFADLVVFFALFLLVVRNERINHFIRFNTMQAILLDIIVFLATLVLQLLGGVPGAAFTVETLDSTIFLGIVAAVAYSVIQSLLGRYAEIPALSDAVYMQVR